MTVTPERAWMLAAARALVRDAPLPRPEGPLDAAALFGQSYIEKCAPVLIAAARASAAPFDPALCETLTTWRDRQRRKDKFLALHTRLLVERLAAAGIPALTLKGVALAWGVWPDPTLRQFEDIDLLLPPDRLREAVALLTAVGFSAPHPLPDGPLPGDDYHLQLLHERWHIGIELHWRVGWRKFNARHFPIAFARLWGESRALALAGGTIRTPGPVHTFILLAIDTVKERHAPLGRFIDAALLIRRHGLTWEAIAPEARACAAETESAALFSTAIVLSGDAAAPALTNGRAVARLRHDLFSATPAPVWTYLALLAGLRRGRGERLKFWRGVWRDRAVRRVLLLTALRDGLRIASHTLNVQRHPIGRRAHEAVRWRVEQSRQRAQAAIGKPPR